jgi:glycolate dehydrogenase FAD-binding subunit
MSISPKSLEQTLSGLLSYPAREASPDDSVAGVQPRVVVEPTTEEEVAAVLAFADREGLKVLVRGGGTQLGLGFPPTGGDILLSTARLNAVLEHEPHDQTISTQSGMRLADVQTHLAHTRQWLALDPALPEAATIGGIISTNASGTRRLRFGAVRDNIIGIRVVLADGTIAKGGGKVVKNVAGYDLPKLYCGALGTLGVIVTANFRLYPLPAARRTVVLTASTPAPLCDLALKVIATTLVPTAIDVFGPRDGDHTYSLAVRFESGVPVSVTDQSVALLALAGGLADAAHVLEDEEEARYWQAADNLVSTPPCDAGTLLLKANLVPSEVAPWLARLGAIASASGLTTRWRAHAGHGIIYAWLAGPPEALPDAVSELRQEARDMHGSLVVQHASPALARALDVWGPVDAIDLIRTLKERFDPQSTLNPGRFVGGI